MRTAIPIHEQFYYLSQINVAAILDQNFNNNNNNNNLFILRKFNINFQMRITMYMRTNNLKTTN